MNSPVLDSRSRGLGHTLLDWRPEDQDFWRREGQAIARRNLWISIPALLLAFAVWMIWSVVAVRLDSLGFKFSTDQLFWLTALPGLSGATLRIFYAFMVPVLGGRRWTVISTASLLIPAYWLGIAVQDAHTSYAVFVMIALLCGFGGGNFASSMANISFFFPKSQQGAALGLNAGLGNLGVSVMQFLVPAVLGVGILGAWAGAAEVGRTGQRLWLQNAGFIWILPILLVTVFAWLGMNDIASARASLSEQMVIFRRKHQWIMSWLYTATFGSFIGFSAGFPLLIKSQFSTIDPLHYAFLGPMVGALARPLGGWMADHVGGARLTFWNFLLMIVATLALLLFLPHAGQGGFFPGFFAVFMVLFITTGIGNGSTFRMIPIIFRTEHERRVAGQGQDAYAAALRLAGRESAASLGFSSAVAAYGAFFIPRAFGVSLSLTGGVAAALLVFTGYYLSCIALTWWFYQRKNAEIRC